MVDSSRARCQDEAGIFDGADGSEGTHLCLMEIFTYQHNTMRKVRKEVSRFLGESR